MKLSKNQIQLIKKSFFSKINLNGDSIFKNKTFELVQNDDETLSIIKDCYTPIKSIELQSLLSAVSSLNELKDLQNPIIKNTITSNSFDNKLEINFSEQASKKIIEMNILKLDFIPETLQTASQSQHPEKNEEKFSKEEEMKIEFINKWAISQKLPNGEYPRLHDDIPITQRTIQDLSNQGYEWFKGVMDRDAAENFLKIANEDTAIVRIGSNNTLVLSKKMGNNLTHTELLVAKKLDEVIGYFSNLRNRTYIL